MNNRVKLTFDEEMVLRFVHDFGGLRIEDVGESLGIAYPKAKRTLHSLSDKALVVTTPNFGYESSEPELPAIERDKVDQSDG